MMNVEERRADAVCDIVCDDRYVPAVAEENDFDEVSLRRWVALWENAISLPFLRHSGNFRDAFGSLCPLCYMQRYCEEHDEEVACAD